MLAMSDVLGDGPGQERDGAAVEAGLDPLLQVGREFLLVAGDLVLLAALARARIGVLLLVALGPRPLTGGRLLLGHGSPPCLGSRGLPRRLGPSNARRRGHDRAPATGKT